MSKKLLHNAGLAALLAAASPTFIDQKAEAAACLNSDVSLTIGGTTYGASSCADNVNNGSPATETTTISNALGLSGFTYLDKSDDAGTATVFGGLRFTVTAPGTNSGTWTVGWVDSNLSVLPNLPFVLDLAVGLFSGNGNNANGSAYLLNNVLLPITPNTGSGFFDINFTNNGGQQPGLSHLTLLGGDVQMPPTTPVPEPASLALLGMGLLGLGAARRARKA